MPVFLNSYDENGITFGTDSNDWIIANSGPAIVWAGAGHDNVQLRYCDDQVHLEAGDDIVTALGGNNMIYGGDGHDSIYLGDGEDHVEGGYGNDFLQGGDGCDMLSGQWGDDIIFGGDGEDELYGSEGNDIISGDDDIDFLSGGEGADILKGGDGDDRIIGGSSTYTVTYSDGTTCEVEGVNQIYGGAGDDLLTGLDGSNLFFYDSHDGNDRISNFDADTDLIVLACGLNGTGIDELSDLTDRVSNTDAGALIDLGNDNSILLEGFEACTIQDNLSGYFDLA